MAKNKGVAAKVTRMNGEAKIRPIPRDRDNTDDILDAVQGQHAKLAHLQAPVGTLSKSAKKGAFNPHDNAAFNGNQISAP